MPKSKVKEKEEVKINLTDDVETLTSMISDVTTEIEKLELKRKQLIERLHNPDMDEYVCKNESCGVESFRHARRDGKIRTCRWCGGPVSRKK